MPYNTENGEITCDVCGANANIPNREKWFRLGDMPSLRGWSWDKDQIEYRCPKHYPSKDEPQFWS